MRKSQEKSVSSQKWQNPGLESWNPQYPRIWVKVLKTQKKTKVAPNVLISMQCIWSGQNFGTTEISNNNFKNTKMCPKYWDAGLIHPACSAGPPILAYWPRPGASVNRIWLTDCLAKYRIYVCIYVYLYVYLYVYMYVYMYMYIYIYIYILYTQMCDYSPDHTHSRNIISCLCC
jgi:hypothetical protein